MKNLGWIGNVTVMFLVDMAVGAWWVGLNDAPHRDFWFPPLEIFLSHGSNVSREKSRWERGTNLQRQDKRGAILNVTEPQFISRDKTT